MELKSKYNMLWFGTSYKKFCPHSENGPLSALYFIHETEDENHCTYITVNSTRYTLLMKAPAFKEELRPMSENIILES